MNEKLESYGDVLMPKDIQEILHIGRNSVYSYLANGTIKSIRIGGKYRIPKAYLIDFLFSDMSSTGKGGDQ